ncbi:MAG: NAD(P)-dependent oxidoreductase [Rhodovarius sp.]|nr:NAD(P)-dependent oxidoreductase [Rhodovarius sp.]
MRLLITAAGLQEVGALPPGVEPLIFDPAAPPRGFRAAFLSRELYFGGSRDRPPPAWLAFIEAVRQEPALEWLQIHSAGADRPVYRELLARGVRITTGAGANAVPVAQTAVGMVLGLGRGLAGWIAAQARREWRPATAPFPPDLQGQKAVVVGLGPVGLEVGRLLAAIGMLPIGISRRPRPAPPPGFITTGIYRELPALLAGVSWLILCCPLSEETRGLVGAAELAAMPRGSFLINVSRGHVVDEAAALAALREGHLAGAFMDVFAEEPLPPDSPWWDAPNCIVAPHAAGPSAGNLARAAAIFRRNLDLFLAGERMINEVEP